MGFVLGRAAGVSLAQPLSLLRERRVAERNAEPRAFEHEHRWLARGVERHRERRRHAGSKQWRAQAVASCAARGQFARPGRRRQPAVHRQRRSRCVVVDRVAAWTESSAALPAAWAAGASRCLGRAGAAHDSQAIAATRVGTRGGFISRIAAFLTAGRCLGSRRESGAERCARQQRVGGPSQRHRFGPRPGRGLAECRPRTAG
jgi:hypothetical protein